MVLLTSAGLFIMTKSVITTYKPIEFKGSFYLNDTDSIITSREPDMSIFLRAAEENKIGRLLIRSHLEYSVSANGKTYELRITSDYNQNRLYFTRISEKLYKVNGQIQLNSAPDATDNILKSKEIQILNLVADFLLPWSQRPGFGWTDTSNTVRTLIPVNLNIRCETDSNGTQKYYLSLNVYSIDTTIRNKILYFDCTFMDDTYMNAFQYADKTMQELNAESENTVD